MFSQNPCVKAVTPHVTVFGDRAFRELIKVKRGPKGGANKGPSSQGHGFFSSVYRYKTWDIRRPSTKILMLSNCGAGEDSCESLGQQGDPTSPS